MPIDGINKRLDALEEQVKSLTKKQDAQTHDLTRLLTLNEVQTKLLWSNVTIMGLIFIAVFGAALALLFKAS